MISRARWEHTPANVAISHRTKSYSLSALMLMNVQVFVSFLKTASFLLADPFLGGDAGGWLRNSRVGLFGIVILKIYTDNLEIY